MRHLIERLEGAMAPGRAEKIVEGGDTVRVTSLIKYAEKSAFQMNSLATWVKKMIPKMQMSGETEKFLAAKVTEIRAGASAATSVASELKTLARGGAADRLEASERPDAVTELRESGDRAVDQAMIGEIDWAPLEAELHRVLKCAVKLVPSAVAKFGKGYLHVGSEDLIKQAGCFRGVFKSVEVDGAGEYNAEKGMLWLPLSLDWKSERGSNGVSILTAWYEFDKKKWIFRAA